MNYVKHFTWTPKADADLRMMLATGFTTSGAAERLGCRHLEAIDRAMRLGISLPLSNNRRVAALASQAIASDPDGFQHLGDLASGIVARISEKRRVRG